MTIQQAFDCFLSDSFEAAADSATKASWNGGGYSVELFADGTYRVAWNNDIGNLYDSDGVIIPIPPLSDEEWDEDPNCRFYDTSRQRIEEAFQAWLWTVEKEKEKKN